MKNTGKTVISLVIVAAIAAAIFALSAQTAAESNGVSRPLTRFFVSLFRPDFSSLATAEQEQLIRAAHRVIREIAHFVEYAALGAALGLFFGFALPRWQPLPRVGLSLAAGAVYAVLDEIHQTFVDGRSMEFIDVCIDSAGVLVGALIVTLILHTVRKRKAST